MTKARRLRPKPPPAGRVLAEGQCEMTLEEMSVQIGRTGSWRREWRNEHYVRQGLDPNRCVLGQAVEINGRKLCTKHAGQVALAILLGEQDE